MSYDTLLAKNTALLTKMRRSAQNALKYVRKDLDRLIRLEAAVPANPVLAAQIQDLAEKEEGYTRLIENCTKILNTRK